MCAWHRTLNIKSTIKVQLPFYAREEAIRIHYMLSLSFNHLFNLELLDAQGIS